MTTRVGPRILVPVLGGDIGLATFARARSALEAPGASLVLLHVIPTEADMSSSSAARPPASAPRRWRWLARVFPAFVDAVAGDPASVILSQAERFRSDLVLLERPAVISRQNAWIAEVIARVQRTARGRVQVLVEPASSSRAKGHRLARALRRRTHSMEASC